MKASPRFKRLVESKLRRLREIKFGQGGDVGIIQRRLDQRMGNLIDLYERLDGGVSQLLGQYKALKRQTQTKGRDALPLNKRDALRLDDTIRELEQAMKASDQLGAHLG